MAELTPELVRRAGIALYGPDWQMPLSRLLGVNERTVRRLAQAVRDGTPYRVTQGWADPIREALEPVPLEREMQGRFAAEVLDALRA